MIPLLSEMILSHMQMMLEHVTKPQIILHTDTGELEIKPGWLSPDAEETFKQLQIEYQEALEMERGKNANTHP